MIVHFEYTVARQAPYQTWTDMECGADAEALTIDPADDAGIIAALAEYLGSRPRRNIRRVYVQPTEGNDWPNNQFRPIRMFDVDVTPSGQVVITRNMP